MIIIIIIIIIIKLFYSIKGKRKGVPTVILTPTAKTYEIFTMRDNKNLKFHISSSIKNLGKGYCKLKNTF